MTEIDLNENGYNRSTRRDQPRFKIWHSAGLMLTYWCSGRCACCYVYCGPEADRTTAPMSVGLALSCWQSIRRLAGPRGKIHITGGEPFRHYHRIEEILQAACDLGLAGLEKVETNAYWCRDEALVRQRLARLDQLGLTRLQISTDIYHQQFIPVESVRLCRRIALEILGPERVQVRWRDFLDNPVELAGLDPDRQRRALIQELARRPERMVGRAAEQLAPLAGELPPNSAIKLISYRDLSDLNCRAVLRAGHVHIDAAGRVFSGTCAGIVLCRVSANATDNLYEQWKRFDPRQHPIWSVLFDRGPVGLAQLAAEWGFVPKACYAGKCHLCFEARKFLFDKGLFSQWLGPAFCYGRGDEG